MEKCVLLISNNKIYPEFSKNLIQLADVFRELDYKVLQFDETQEFFQDLLKEFIEKTKKDIECKAIISCNAIGIEILSGIKHILCCTFFTRHPGEFSEKFIKANKDYFIYCFNEEYVKYIRLNWKNVVNVVNIPYNNEKSWIMALSYMAMEIQEQVAIKQGTASVLKLLIQNELNNGNLQQIESFISKYKTRNPEDMDLIAIEVIFNLSKGNVDLALQFALEGVRKYPCNADMHYNLASIYEKQENWYNALLSYGKAYTIYNYNKSMKAEKLNLKNLIFECRQKYEANRDTNKEMSYEEMTRNGFGLWESAFRNYQQIVGGYYWESEKEKRYIGVYRDTFFHVTAANHMDLSHIKGEFLKVVEGKEYFIDQTETDVLLPIAVENKNTIHEIWNGNKKYIIQQIDAKHFNYYRLSAGTRIYSSMKAYYGTPIPLCQKQDKKKLVLNIFVDGLAQCILDGDKFEKNMPYTAHFFGNGIVCNNAYSAADWTYPSLANYVTGLDTSHHMLFHSDLDGKIPEEYPTLAEYFHEKGYFTSTIGGNWRAIPIYGHARGYDQFIYQHEWTGYKAEMVIGNVIDQIETFKETNQFLWITIGDLHDIGDGIDLPNSVQSRMVLEERVYEQKGETSVKQNYSMLKIMAYERMATRVDVLLNVLYQYLDNNYNKDEIIVSLFADHGQGYLIPMGEHFMSRGRSNVAFMFKGAGIKPRQCEEIISASDYIKIMCKLADIEMKNIEIDGRLPKVFGGEGREYALSESIHPNDPYYAAIYEKDINFYFENSYPIQNDGRFYLKEYKVWITDKQGKIFYDVEKTNKYLNIIMEHIKPLLIYD